MARSAHNSYDHVSRIETITEDSIDPPSNADQPHMKLIELAEPPSQDELIQHPTRIKSEEAVIAAARDILDDYYAEMRTFQERNAGDVLVSLAAYSAYASELRTRLVRLPGTRINQFRIKEIDPFLKEVDRQFKIWSRVAAVRQFEWDASRGGI